MDFLGTIRRETEHFYSVAEGADPAKRVPSCPDWCVADLVWHLGEVHWFWASIVESRASQPDEVEALKPARPDGYDDVVAFGRASGERLLRVLADNDDSLAVWTWALEERDHSVGFIRRHQVQEAAVHRWDLQLAVSGEPDPIDADVAVDSIDEYLSITLPWMVAPDKPLPGSLHLHCTDTDGEWFVHADGRVERAHAKGDVALRGSASDLLLVLCTRIPVERLDVIGDAAVVAGIAARFGAD